MEEGIEKSLTQAKSTTRPAVLSSQFQQRQSNPFLDPCTYSEGFEGCIPQAIQIEQDTDPIRTGHRRH